MNYRYDTASLHELNEVWSRADYAVPNGLLLNTELFRLLKYARELGENMKYDFDRMAKLPVDRRLNGHEQKTRPSDPNTHALGKGHDF